MAVTEISGQNFVVTIADGSVVIRGVFEIHDKQAPKAIDWIDVSGPHASSNPIPAIYELSETSFVFCAACDGTARPSTFATAPGQVLRRMMRI